MALNAAGSSNSQLDLLQEGITDQSIKLTTLLIRVLFLGVDTRYKPLRTWALRELKGYNDAESFKELPEYRMAPALFQGVVRNGFRIETRELSAAELPVGQMRDHLTEQMRGGYKVPDGIGKIESLVATAPADGSVTAAVRGGVELAVLTSVYWRQQGKPYVLDRVQWAMHVSALQDVFDQVRVRLAEFVAELRLMMPEENDGPTTAQVKTAFQHIVINAGDNSPVTVNAAAAHAEPDGHATAGSSPSAGGEKDGDGPETSRRRFRRG